VNDIFAVKHWLPPPSFFNNPSPFPLNYNIIYQNTQQVNPEYNLYFDNKFETVCFVVLTLMVFIDENWHYPHGRRWRVCYVCWNIHVREGVYAIVCFSIHKILAKKICHNMSSGPPNKQLRQRTFNSCLVGRAASDSGHLIGGASKPSYLTVKIIISNQASPLFWYM